MNLFTEKTETLMLKTAEHRAIAKKHTSPRLQAKHNIMADNIDNELRCRARGWCNRTGSAA